MPVRVLVLLALLLYFDSGVRVKKGEMKARDNKTSLTLPSATSANFSWWCQVPEEDCICAKVISPGDFGSLHDFTPVLVHALSSKSGSPSYKFFTKATLGGIAMMLAGETIPDILVDMEIPPSCTSEENIVIQENYTCISGSENLAPAVATCLKLQGVRLVQAESVSQPDTLVLCSTPYNLPPPGTAEHKLKSLCEKLRDRISFNKLLWSIHAGEFGSQLDLHQVDKDGDSDVMDSINFWDWWKTRPASKASTFEVYKVGSDNDSDNAGESGPFLFHGMRDSFFNGDAEKPGLVKTGMFDLLSVGARNHGFHGAGIYFSESACEAYSYGWGGGCEKDKPCEPHWYVLVVTMGQAVKDIDEVECFQYSSLQKVQSSVDRIVSKGLANWVIKKKKLFYYKPSYGLRNTPDEDSAFRGGSTLDEARRDSFGCHEGNEVIVFAPHAIRIHYVVKFSLPIVPGQQG